MTTPFLLALVLAQAPATPLADAVARVDAATFAVDAPEAHDKIVVGGLLYSASVSMIPVAATVRCLTKEQCREANPLMAKLLGPTADGWKRATTVKVAGTMATHYLLWRVLPDDTPTQRKWKRIAVLAVAAFNTWDAWNDLAVMRRIEQREPAQR